MIKNHIRTAFRNISRQKIFSFVNITGLGLSLAAVWFISLYIHDELSYDRYNTKVSRIYRLVTHGSWGNEKFDITGSSGLAAAALKKDYPEVEDAVRLDIEGGGIVSYGAKSFKEEAIFLTDPSFFHVFTFHFIAGSASALQRPNTIVLTKTLASQLFRAPEDALNKTVYIDKNPAEVTGVINDVPENSHFRFTALRAMPANYPADWKNLSLYTYLLLKKPTDVSHLRAELPSFAARYMGNGTGDETYRLELQPLSSIHLRSHLSYELGENHYIQYIYVLCLVGLLILGIAFINYTNITTARASVRLREVAVRKIVGAGKRNLLALFLAESVLTMFFAALLSFMIVVLMMPLFNTLAGKQLDIWQFGLAPMVLSLLSFTLVGGVAGGLYPAIFLTRFRPASALKNQMGEAKGQVFFRKSLVLFQFIVTVILITASMVIFLQLRFMRTADLGFNKNHVITFHLDSREVRQKVPELREALLENPLITAVASAGNPIGNNDIGMMDYNIEKDGAFEPHSYLAYGLIIDPDFIPALQIHLLEGRNFSKSISSDSNAVIVNEALLKSHGWASGAGKRISLGTDAAGKVSYMRIIGVVKDYHIYSLQHKIDPMIMTLPKVAGDRDNMYVRLADANTTRSLAAVEKTYRKFVPSALFDYHFLDQNFQMQYSAEEKQGKIILAFTLLAVCIACLGLFGLVTFTVSRRVKEIGVRKVLGAGAGRITILLMKDVLIIVVLAMLIATPVSWLSMHQWLDHFAYQIHLNWWLFPGAGVLAVLVAVITIGFQAYKAAIANPANSLRSE